MPVSSSRPAIGEVSLENSVLEGIVAGAGKLGTKSVEAAGSAFRERFGAAKPQHPAPSGANQ